MRISKYIRNFSKKLLSKPIKTLGIPILTLPLIYATQANALNVKFLESMLVNKINPVVQEKVINYDLNINIEKNLSKILINEEKKIIQNKLVQIEKNQSSQIIQKQKIKEDKYSNLNAESQLIKELNEDILVKKGSCLSIIASNISKKYGEKLRWGKLRIANNIDETANIKNGDRLKLPNDYKISVFDNYIKKNNKNIKDEKYNSLVRNLSKKEFQKNLAEIVFNEEIKDRKNNIVQNLNYQSSIIKPKQIFKEYKYSNLNDESQLIKDLSEDIIVKKGSCLSIIASNISKKYGEKLRWGKLRIANNIGESENLEIGDLLKLPDDYKKKVIINSIKKNNKNIKDEKYNSLVNKLSKKEFQKSEQLIENKISLYSLKNETLQDISKKYQIPYTKIVENNPHIKNKLKLDKGTSIDILVEAGYSIQGYTINQPNKNWKIAKSKSGEEIEKDRKRFGVKGFSKLLGIKPGASGNLDKYGSQTINLIKDPIENTSKKYNIDKKTLYGMIFQETGGLQKKDGDLNKIMSNEGCLGAGQLSNSIYGKRLHSNGEIWEAINPLNLHESIDRAGKYYNLLVNKYNSKILAITAYNTGEKHINQAIKKVRQSNPKDKQGIWNIIYAKDDNGEYFISKQGRNYYRHVQKKIKKYNHLTKIKPFYLSKI